MPIPVKCVCGASYSLKDEFAGQVLKCPQCGTTLQVGYATSGAPTTTPQADPAFDRDKFLLRQQHLSISEKYYVNDEQGNPILFVQRPARMGRQILALLGVVAAIVVWWVLVVLVSGVFASDDAKAVVFLLGFLGMFPVLIVVAVALSPLRHVTFYRDDSMAEQLIEVMQDSKWQIPTATYTLRDAAGTALAKFRKNYLFDIFRKKWECQTGDGRELCVAREDSILLSMLRRLLGPLFGILRTNFVIESGGQVIGEFNRKFTILDRYVLDMSQDPRRTLDRRIAIALGVMLDTGERR